MYEAEVVFVWDTLHRLGVRSADIEDIAHDVFVKVHNRLGDYDPERPIRPWLFGIAFGVASDYRRSARIRRETDAERAPDPVDNAALADEQLATRQAHELMLEALDTLEFDARAVFVMHELDETPVPEIASVLGIPLNTAYSRLRLARKGFLASVRRIQKRRGEA